MADKAPGVPEGLSTAPVTDLPALETEASTGEETTAPEQATPPKRRRKRGPNKPKAPVTGEVSDPNKERQELAQLSEALGASFQMTGNLIAALRSSDHWKVTTEEAKNLGDVWAVALRPYMGAMAPYMPFVAATVVTIGVFAPKVKRDRELQRARTSKPVALPVVSDVPIIAEGSSATSQLEVDPETRTTPTPDAPHLAVEGGFLPPSPERDPTLGSVPGSASARRRRNAPA